MELIFGLIGLLIGLIIGIIIPRLKVSGYLRVDTSDPTDQPYLFLELSKPPQTLKRKKYVMFKVNPKNYISHD